LPPASPSLGELLLTAKANLSGAMAGLHTAFVFVVSLHAATMPLVFIGEGVRDHLIHERRSQERGCCLRFKDLSVALPPRRRLLTAGGCSCVPLAEKKARRWPL
jgi:hypothetical protein